MKELHSDLLRDLKIDAIKWSFYRDYTTYCYVSDNIIYNLNEEIFQKIVSSKSKEDLVEYLLDSNLLSRRVAGYVLEKLENE